MRLPGKHVPPRGRERQEALAKFDIDTGWKRWSTRTFSAERIRQRRKRWLLTALVVLLLVALLSVAAELIL